MKTLLRISLVTMLAVVLAGCGIRHQTTVSRTSDASSRPASAPKQAPTPAAVQPKSYTVVRGDTLYSIAVRHNVDFRDLARWNGLAAPYTIYPGQNLRVNGVEASKPVASAPAASQQPTPAAEKPAPEKQVVSASPAPTQPPVAVEVERPSTPTPVQPNPPASTVPPQETPNRIVATAPPEIPSAGTRSVDGIAWRWPTNGHVVATYAAGDQTRQGLGIAGNAGQPVLASADGEVVYSGAGLLGYGELIIIKHSETYLSAYGHNRKRLVTEGDKVRGGQQIAEMGRSGAARDMLHFEIRKNGKPVDPIGFLPKR